jgi:hypothetical protein
MVSDAEVRAWLQANPGANDAQIAAAMQQYGVSTDQMARVTGIAPATIQQRFDAAVAPAPAPISSTSVASAPSALTQTESSQTQYVREAPEIEALKYGLMESARQQIQQPMDLPAFQAAGPSPLQVRAYEMGEAGVGAYAPFFNTGQQLLGEGISQVGAGTAALQGPSLTEGIGQVGKAGALTPQFLSADFGQSQQMLGTAATQALGSAAQPEFMQAQQALGAGMGAAGMAGPSDFGTQAQQLQRAVSTGQLSADQARQAAQLTAPERITTGSVTAPGALGQYMSPYMQNVLDIQMREAQRQADIARQGRAAQAVRSGAFGGSREAIMEAEAARNLAQQKGDIQATGLQQAFQQAQQQFNVEEQARLGAQQANVQAGLQAGIAGGQLGLQAAAQQFQQAGFDAQTAMQMAQLQQARQQQAVQQSQLYSGIGSIYGQLGGQIAGLEQGAAGQLAGIGGVMGQQAAQQTGLGQAGLGLMGTLGTQQANLEMQRAGALGQMGQLYGSMAGQQTGFGQLAQQLGIQDINTLYSLGQAEQQMRQQQIEAGRATQLQSAMAPYQQLGFLSDIYRGAPSTQMTLTAGTAPTASPFQQIVGTGAALLSGVSGAQKAGLFGT